METVVSQGSLPVGVVKVIVGCIMTLWFVWLLDLRLKLGSSIPMLIMVVIIMMFLGEAIAYFYPG